MKPTTLNPREFHRYLYNYITVHPEPVMYGRIKIISIMDELTIIHHQLKTIYGKPAEPDDGFDWDKWAANAWDDLANGKLRMPGNIQET